MLYGILVYETDADFQQRTGPDAPAYWGAYMAYNDALKKANVAAGGNALQPPHTATTIRHRDGKRVVHDGPFADTKEQLAGIFVIDVPDLDAAIEWGSKCPAATAACVEVRPILPMNKP